MRVGAVQITGNTITHDDVVRRQLRLRPGHDHHDRALRRDYERLNNLGYFEKVELEHQARARSEEAVRDHARLERQRAAHRHGATIGAGYSGGANGTGLTGNLSYSQNNINGTGNGAHDPLRARRAALRRVALGDDPVPRQHAEVAEVQPRRFDLRAEPDQLLSGLRRRRRTSVAPDPNDLDARAPSGTSAANATPGDDPGHAAAEQSTEFGTSSATYKNRSTGVSVNLGRRLTDYVTATPARSIQRISTDVTVPSPYYVSRHQTIAVNSADRQHLDHVDEHQQQCARHHRALDRATRRTTSRTTCAR